MSEVKIIGSRIEKQPQMKILLRLHPDVKKKSFQCQMGQFETLFLMNWVLIEKKMSVLTPETPCHNLCFYSRCWLYSRMLYQARLKLEKGAPVITNYTLLARCHDPLTGLQNIASVWHQKTMFWARFFSFTLDKLSLIQTASNGQFWNDFLKQKVIFLRIGKLILVCTAACFRQSLGHSSASI